MFKGLRNRFVILHMGIVTLIVFVFFGTLLISNYRNMQGRSDEILNREIEPRFEMSRGIMPPRGKFEPRFSPVFTVETDSSNNITNIVSAFNIDVDGNFYKDIVNLAVNKKQESGMVSYDGGYFKFKFNRNRIIFLDISKEMEMFTNTIYTFLWITLPLLLVIFFISLYFANRSIKPVEESYNKQKEFIADASHELKTPLAAIMTNVEMLLGNSRNEQKKWLYYIKAETERMASLTSSLLFLTKLDYVKNESASSIINFSKLLEDYLIPLEALFYEHKIKTRIDIFPNVMIYGDSEQIRRLVGTLVDNAIKYTDGNISITLGKSESNAKLTVYNTGKGISKTEISKIWERFYRGDKSRDSAGGFGLGLPIAKAITEKHGGNITVESSEDEWTRFNLKIPLEK